VKPDFAQAIETRLAGGLPPAVVGLDPRVEAFPANLRPDSPPADRIRAFYSEVLPVLAEHVPAVKPNIAFFEAFGHRGYQVYEEVCAQARVLGMLVIGDIKRGDIGSTAAAYAEEHFRHANALTLHPYLGRDAVQPFLDRCTEGDRGVFVLVRTSNAGAADFQDLELSATAGGGRVCDAVARTVATWAAETGPADQPYSPVGAVVGATWPKDLERLRELMPRCWLLLPGVGAQGATVRDVAAAFDARGRGALINQSRGILQCFAPDSARWLEEIGAAAQQFAAETAEVAGT